MLIRDILGTRMKTYYEEIPKTKLMRRTPVAIRIDGKAFHIFTRGFQKPFDEILIKSMQETMKYLCENIQGCVLGYTQSDEITLILQDYAKLDTCAWFDYEVQKICSISASMATMIFNQKLHENVRHWCDKNELSTIRYFNEDKPVELKQLYETYWNAVHKGAMFDARCFNIPKEEVTNLVYWRQLDAARNSVQMVGQAYFSHKELQNKSCSDIQDMLMEKYNINWNNLPAYLKRGSCCVKNIDLDEYGVDWGSGWRIDNEIPLFKGEDRKYIEKLINFEN